MNRSDLGIWLGVVSKGRPETVEKLQSICGPATWYVDDDEGELYMEAGAGRIVLDSEYPGKRSHVLDDGFALGLPTFVMDDDVQEWVLLDRDDDGGQIVRPATFEEVLGVLFRGLKITGARLAGGPPTPNAFYVDINRPIKTRHFVNCYFHLVLPTHLRYDPTMYVKEDYDYTLQHIREYGAVARCERVLPHFQHERAKGGCSWRTDEDRDICCARLIEKWGDWVRPHPRRAHEVLLSVPQPKRAKRL